MEETEKENPDLYDFRYGYYYPRGARYMASAIICAICIPNITNFLFLTLLVIALIYAWSQGGREVDFKNNRYKEYQDLFLFKLGEWKNIKPSYLSVFKAKMGREFIGKYETNTYQVNLITERKERITLFESETSGLAFAYAVAIAKRSWLRVLDATEREQKWVDIQNYL